MAMKGMVEDMQGVVGDMKWVVGDMKGVVEEVQVLTGVTLTLLHECLQGRLVHQVIVPLQEKWPGADLLRGAGGAICGTEADLLQAGGGWMLGAGVDVGVAVFTGQEVIHTPARVEMIGALLFMVGMMDDATSTFKGRTECCTLYSLGLLHI
uniref:Uncharacterized protein n=1 Tax=Aegilops tauschii TaxID=37682 RepID=M8BQB6_AEGTA